MNAITNAIMSHSKLNVTLIKIPLVPLQTDATPDSFMMAIESKVTGTGPVSSTISEMTVDLVGPGGAFGKLALPVIKTRSSGTDVNIASQLITITDRPAFRAFVHALLRDESLLLQLRNGKGTVKALGMTADINYNKDCPLAGMHGPKTTIARAAAAGAGAGFTSTLVVSNPSPLEIDLGTIKQELRNADGTVVAVQQGRAYLSRGQTEFVVTGTPTGAAAAGPEATLVATGVVEDNWHNETITAFEGPVVLPKELLDLCA
ncbi:hypothetical protein B2J93_4452 [Marssonina coronariae]|uniref:Uncharacterized protein n=1 Tax=Diplocarpon coronariae TaxID=2795749 RepID=A0A218Z9H3_9HELO|nr:hypothetical protein B2J93_4452 [Marssonina coronariae]